VSQFIRHFGRLGVIVTLICAPTMLSFGNDQSGGAAPQGYSTPQAPVKTIPPTSGSCAGLGSLTQFNSTWKVGQLYPVIVTFGNATQASQCTNAVLCFSCDTPACTTVDAVGNAGCVGGPRTSMWNAVAIAPLIGTPNALVMVFQPTRPTSGQVCDEGTGRGIIIVTQSVPVTGRVTKYVVSGMANFNH
jgi:hypothetical protein